MPFLYVGYFQYYMYMLPALLLVFFAQGMVSARYNKFSKISTFKGITGEQVAQAILQQNGIVDVQVQGVGGKMTDHYHPTQKKIYLSQGVLHSTSIAAIGIAAHEAGHAVQHAKGYVPVQIRTALVPVCNIASRIGLPLAIIGFILANASAQNNTIGYLLVNIGLILFATAALFQLVTLPVELNASRRALAFLKESNWFSGQEYAGCKKVLTAAAFTYVAALAQSVLQLLYFISRFSGGRRE